MASDTQDKKIKNATKWAIGFTVIWLSCFFILLFIKRCTISGLELNEWGDLIAGTFAPLAFFWLVYGYFQQGQELRLNREALLLQQRELAEQVKATQELAKHAETEATIAKNNYEQLMVDRKKQQMPKLIIKSARTDGIPSHFHVENIGADIFNIKIGCSFAKEVDTAIDSVLKKDEKGLVQFYNPQHCEQQEIYVTFTTRDGLTFKQVFLIDGSVVIFKAEELEV